MFLMWLGEQITARGVGNGISLIIFAGSSRGFRWRSWQLFDMARTGSLSTVVLIGLLVLMLIGIAVIVFMERAQSDCLSSIPNDKSGIGCSRATLAFAAEAELGRRHSSDFRVIAFAACRSRLRSFPSGKAHAPEWLTSITAALGRGQPLYLLIYFR